MRLSYSEKGRLSRVKMGVPKRRAVSLMLRERGDAVTDDLLRLNQATATVRERAVQGSAVESSGGVPA